MCAAGPHRWPQPQAATGVGTLSMHCPATEFGLRVIATSSTDFACLHYLPLLSSGAVHLQRIVILAAIMWLCGVPGTLSTAQSP